MTATIIHYSIKTQVEKIWAYLERRRKKQLGALCALTILVSFAEVISIGSVLPFLGALSNQEKLISSQFLSTITENLQIKNSQQALTFFTYLFATAAIISGILRILLIWIQTRLSISIGADLSVKVYENSLYQSYASHLISNSSETLAGSQKANNLVSHIIQPILNILSSLAILLAVIITLIYIQPFITLFTFLAFAFIYYVIVSLTRRQIFKNSQIIALQQGRVIKAVQEGIGGIRDVLIDGTQALYTKLYREALFPMRIATSNNQVLGASPRYGIEALGMVFIAIMAYLLTKSTNATDGGINNSITTLGVLALGIQRLLPIIQQIYTSYIQIKSNQSNIQDAIELLSRLPEEVKTNNSIDFKSNIIIKNLGFKYNFNDPWIFRNINLKIPKGSRFGFVGVTGSGKSTLLDVVMGLLAPTEGGIYIDGAKLKAESIRAWQSHISHVPQSIYLTDASITENIAFGVPLEKIDFPRVIQSAEQAKISSLIDDLREGYDTIVGERGVRLSGGQRQRIGIARALYKRANVIIFDEATSALDNETENEVMHSIEGLGREITILIIAHRLTTLSCCDIIVNLEKGSLTSIGKFNQVINSENI